MSACSTSVGRRGRGSGHERGGGGGAGGRSHMSKLINSSCDSKRLSREAVVFLFDGHVVSTANTPEEEGREFSSYINKGSAMKRIMGCYCARYGVGRSTVAFPFDDADQREKDTWGELQHGHGIRAHIALGYLSAPISTWYQSPHRPLSPSFCYTSSKHFVCNAIDISLGFAVLGNSYFGFTYQIFSSSFVFNIGLFMRGERIYLGINKGSPLKRIFITFCKRYEFGRSSCLLYEGRRLSRGDTPDEAGLQDSDEIQVVPRAIGGGYDVNLLNWDLSSSSSS
ncbi:hypothetical protein K1719_040359 [Acacia pycnantha]|nr:hypothetical protein K1719_040359 [Acacia pycnantha]